VPVAANLLGQGCDLHREREVVARQAGEQLFRSPARTLRSARARCAVPSCDRTDRAPYRAGLSARQPAHCGQHPRAELDFLRRAGARIGPCEQRWRPR
jgi:hypothetical protein